MTRLHSRKGIRWFALVASCVGVFAVQSACYGPHTVKYIDSTRIESDKEFNHDLDQSRVQYEKCGPAGVARIETYSGWFDMLVSYLTYSDADRSVDITCAKEQ